MSTDPREDEAQQDDPEMTGIVADETRLLAKVHANLATPSDRPSKNYDKDLVELRDMIGEARLEDVPALVAEMERLRQVATRRAEVAEGVIDPRCPYFGHMRLEEGERTRDVLIGNATYVDTERGVRVVDWRDAPVSRIYYRYAEGDDYEEDFGGRALEGTVRVRRAVVIRDGVLRRVVAPQGTFLRASAGWRRAEAHHAKLAGGQLTAVRPPTEEERRAARGQRGKLGVGAEGREDRHLPDIPALIDPRQFELITRPTSGLVVIQGGAGSGKTTIGLHRMAYLAFNQPKRFAPDRMLVVVFNRALASYISRVLPGLGVEGVPVTTFTQWVAKQRVRHVQGVPTEYAEDTPPVVGRLKKHPVMLRLIAAHVAKAEAEAREAVLAVGRRNDAEPAVAKAWDALEKAPLARRVSGLLQWLRGDLELPVGGARSLGSRTQMELQRALERLLPRARNIVWDWAELVTDAKTLRDGFARWAPGAFTDAEIVQAVRWCSTQTARWVARGDEEDEGEGEPEKKPEARDEADREEAEALAREARPHTQRRRRDEDEDDDGDDGDDAGPVIGVDGVVEGDEPARVDVEDDALLVRYYQLKRGPLRGGGKQPLRYEHLFVDEAQDLSPVELAVLVEVTSPDRSITLAGDVAQRLLMDNGFTDWQGVLRDLGLEGVAVEPLKIGYRSTREVLALARAVLGPLAEEDPPLATRSGAPVEFHRFSDVGAAVAFLGEALRTLAMDEPRANVAVIARDPARATMYYDGLVRAEVPRLRRVADQDFAFRPGVEVTDVRQVKGLEFDYVIMVDVTAGNYPTDDESRHLLHIGATRAAHQLWLVAAGVPSPLVPEHLVADAEA